MGGEAAERNPTLADLIAAKGKRLFSQATATTAEEAQAADAAGIDILSLSAGAELVLIRAAAPPHAKAYDDFPGRMTALQAAQTVETHPEALNVFRDAIGNVYK